MVIRVIFKPNSGKFFSFRCRCGMREVRLLRESFVLSLVLKQPSPVSLVFGQRSPVRSLVFE